MMIEFLLFYGLVYLALMVWMASQELFLVLLVHTFLCLLPDRLDRLILLALQPTQPLRAKTREPDARQHGENDNPLDEAAKLSL